MTARTLAEYAADEKRDYVTPEDVQLAVNAGIDKLALYTELLQHIERKNVEDVTLSAFVALQYTKDASENVPDSPV